jgi:hypothetical protein
VQLEVEVELQLEASESGESETVSAKRRINLGGETTDSLVIEACAQLKIVVFQPSLPAH